VTGDVIDPGLARIGREAARRLQRSGLEAKGRLRLPAITQGEISSLSGLLGGRWRAPLPGADATVDLASLDRALRSSSYGCTLLDLATAVHGSALVDAVALRAAAEAERRDGWAVLKAHPAVVRDAILGGWLDRERASGAAVRSAAGAPFGLLRAVLDLVASLPADPPMSLARFATLHRAGDPHALDRDRPLDAVLRRALAHLDGDDAPLAGAAARRERYDRWGLCCDELSGTVLCCGLHASGESRLARSLRLAAAAGEPRVLTLRELRAVTTLACGPVVFTCENPDVVAAAADELGARCPPLVCTEGWPSTACVRLLRALLAGGATALHHGDMDRGGLRIVDRLLAVTGGAPWRMTAVDHEAHRAGGVRLADGVPIVVRDPRLRQVAEAIALRGRLVREEQMIRALLDDLRSAGHAAQRPARETAHALST
jgi:uncharacterized protein (TIGR02679 family)